ncbi:MAG TPA: DUF4234 domain-containing protein [Pseudomonadales bacterium]|nr:DUF4234 domain-containing protein [Pseudomonadales bacterium]
MEIFPAPKNQADLNRLPAMSLLSVLLFTVATLGVYSWWWLYSRSLILNSLLPKERTISKPFMHLCLAGFGITFLLVIDFSYQPDNLSLKDTINVLMMALNIMAIVWVFRFRAGMHFLLGPTPTLYHLNAVWTFLFPIFYVQHKINLLHEHNQPGIM